MNKLNNYIIENYQGYKIKALNKKKIDDSFLSNKSYEKENRKEQIIVNLTSFPERMNDIYYTLYSLLSQSLIPDKVILWLTFEENPDGIKNLPKEVLKLMEYGLEIEFCHNLRAYNKLIPSLKKYPHAVHITADDDIFYKKNWLKGLYNDYLKFGNNYIYAYRIHEVVMKNDKLYKYEKWKKAIKSEKPSYLNFLTGVGGVLYPANIFNKEVFNEKQFTDLSPRADDIWFWAMAVLNNIKTKVVPGFDGLVYVNPERELRLNGEMTLAAENVKLGGNDLQIRQVLANYPILGKLQQEYKKIYFK